MGETEFIKKKNDVAVASIVFHFLVNIFPSGCIMYDAPGKPMQGKFRGKKVPQWFLVKFGCTDISRDTN